MRLDRVEITVLDEADHMADLGFLPGVTRILAATPQGGQRMLFSATLDRGVDGLVRRFLRDEVRHEVDDQSVPQGEMTHRVFMVDGADEKPALVRHLASGRGRRILFTRTKHQAKKLAKQLTAAGIPAVDLHGNLSQAARERNLAAFGADAAKGGVRVLVATDVAARGVHVDDVELVVHVDPPMEHKAYLHRSGRTARAGAAGTVVTVAIPAQRRDVADLLRKAGIQAPLEQVAAECRADLRARRRARRARAPGARPGRRRSASPSPSPRRPSRAAFAAVRAGARSRSGRRFHPARPVAATPLRRAAAETPPARSARPPGLLDRNRSARPRGARPGTGRRPARRDRVAPSTAERVPAHPAAESSGDQAHSA